MTKQINKFIDTAVYKGFINNYHVFEAQNKIFKDTGIKDKFYLIPFQLRGKFKAGEVAYIYYESGPKLSYGLHFAYKNKKVE